MAEFRIDQTGGAGAGVAGQSRFDLVPGVAVTLVATAPVGAGVSYAWEIIDAVNTTGTLSALTGTSVTIAAPGITQNSGFRVRLTADDNGNVTTVDRVFGVRSTYAGIRPPLFGEQAPATQRLGSNVPDLSTDNALYANLSGRGAPGQNPFGWREWGWELTQALEQVTDNLANLPPPPVSGNVFVYDSAATPVDNLYNSWAALYADAVLRESSVVIELRSDLTIPAGNYAMPPVIFRSTEFVSPGQAPTLTFDSAILTASSFGFERLDLEVTATTAASPLVCPSGFILLDFVNTNATPPGAAALLDVGPSDSVLVRAHGANIGPGSVFANLGANAVLFLYADDFISFNDGCFTGAASSALYLTANTASAGFGTIPQTMSLFAGTYSPYFLSRASNTFFDDTLVSPPLSATDVQGAIDALKGLTTNKVPTTRTVSTTAPLAGGGALSGNLTLSITAATSSAAGSMSAADKTKLDGITAGAAVASVSGTAPITSSGGTTPAIGISAATTLAAGSMSASDKSKLDGIGSGATVASVGSGSTAISIGGTASVPTVAVAQDAAQGTTSTRKIATTTPSGIGGAAAAGTSTQAAAADHVHVLHETGGADLTLGAISDGQLLARSGTTIAGVVPGITSSTATRNNLRLANAYVASIGAVTLRAIAWNGSVYCAVGASGQCYTSPDGITWTSRSMGDSNTHTDIVWASSLGLFVAVGDGTSNAQGVVKTSPDGITWTSRVSAAAPPTNYSVAWSGSLLVTVGTSPISPTTSTIRTSPDGINWTQRTSSASVSLFAVVWNPVAGLFVAVGSTGTIVTSPDGITWTTRTSGTANNLYGLAVNPSTGRMVAVGATGTFITSSDGINWSATDTLYNAGTSNYALVTYGDGLFLVGPFSTGTGYWVSTDGIRWSSRIMSTGLTFGNALGGQRNCIFANNKWLWVGNGATYSDTVS